MDDKKRAAAIAAVTAYLQKEEEEVIEAFETAAPAFANLWGTSGRQAQMQLRSMMQLKAFQGSRMR